MRAPPRLTEFARFPVVAGTALLAIGVTLASWTKVDVTPLYQSAMIRRGELWRLITSILPHGSVLHLLFNVYWLWVFGTIIEEVYGHLKTAGLIVLFALGSGAFEFAFAAGGIGLSGVGYGLFGLLWILSKRDERFHDAVDSPTVQLFIGWFFFCIITTMLNIFPVANLAHGAGAVFGILTADATTNRKRRLPIAAAIAIILAFGIWGSTLGRPRMNLSGKQGYEESEWGYQALLAGRNQEAIRWLEDAVQYQPTVPACWFDLGIAYQRAGDREKAKRAYRKASDLEPNNKKYSAAAKEFN